MESEDHDACQDCVRVLVPNLYNPDNNAPNALVNDSIEKDLRYRESTGWTL
jgi:hypothetical protein